MIEKINQSNDDGVVTVCEAARHPQFNLLREDSESQLLRLWDDDGTKNFQRATRRQETTNAYDLTTVAFVYRVGYIRNCAHILDGNIGGIIVDKIEGIDIDTLDELEYARYLIETKGYVQR